MSLSNYILNIRNNIPIEIFLNYIKKTDQFEAPNFHYPPPLTNDNIYLSKCY